MKANWAILKTAIDGDEGGNGAMYSLAFDVAPISCPAKTVAKVSTFLSNSGLLIFFGTSIKITGFLYSTAKLTDVLAWAITNLEFFTSSTVSPFIIFLP